MNSTSPHPTHRPNLCFCGHDIRAHNLGVSPNTCALCTPSSNGNPNVHPFTSHNDLNPIAFGSSDLPRTISPANLGAVSPSRNSTGTGNGAGSMTLQVGGGALTFLFPGMTVTTIPSQIGNQQTYTIVSAVYNSGTGNTTLTLTSPLRVGANNTVCIFRGALGSGFGPGRPPNGQRAG